MTNQLSVAERIEQVADSIDEFRAGHHARLLRAIAQDARTLEAVPGDVGELVAWLRDAGNGHSTMNEAANIIEAQAREIARLKDAIDILHRGRHVATLNRESAEKERDELRDALSKLRLNAELLFLNSLGCAAQHYGHDIELNGLPGWLADCKPSIDKATELLSTLNGEEGNG